MNKLLYCVTGTLFASTMAFGIAKACSSDIHTALNSLPDIEGVEIIDSYNSLKFDKNKSVITLRNGSIVDLKGLTVKNKKVIIKGGKGNSVNYLFITVVDINNKTTTYALDSIMSTIRETK